MILHVVRAGESLWSIVRNLGLLPYDKAMQKIVNINRLISPSYIVVGQTLSIPTEGLYYVVQPGDSLWKISRVFNIPVNTLASYNNISNPSQIQVGFELRFPKGTNGYLTNPGQYLICIDAGHQQTPNYTEEPYGPGSIEMAAAVYSGTQGVITGKPEYELNLEVALKVQAMLEQRGFNVLMIRTTNNVNISNVARAVIANNANADLAVHIHANGSSDPSENGISVLYPSTDNPFVDTQTAEESQVLAEYLYEELLEFTGANGIGAYADDEVTVLNWTEIPAALVEMGFMTNPMEDQRMSDPDYQNLLAQGIVYGIQDFLYYDE